MHYNVKLFVYADERSWRTLAEILLAAGCAGSAKDRPSGREQYSITLPEDSPGVSVLRSRLSQTDLDWTERRELVTTEQDRSTAPLLNVIVRRAEQGHGGPTYGTRYDLSGACPKCGTGARQSSPLILKKSEIPKQGDIFRTYDRDVLVSRRVGHALVDEGLTGVDLGEVQDLRTGEALPWLQLQAPYEMPPMHPSTTGLLRERPCPVCGRDGYFHTVKEPLLISYSKGDVDVGQIPDVVSTYERFGISGIRSPLRKSQFAAPLLLVKPKVYGILKTLGIKRLEFVPVSIVD